MFVLNCPSCGHKSRVKFARMGAVATCVGCKQKFKVESRTLIVEEDSDSPEIAPEAASSAMPVEPQSESAAVMPSVDDAGAEAAIDSETIADASTGDPLTATQALEGALDLRSTATAKKPRRAAVPPRLARKGRGLSPAIIALIVVGILGFGGGIAYLIVNRTTGNGTTQNPGAPEDGKGDPLNAQNIIRVSLQTPPNNEVKWQRISPAAEPFKPTPADDTAVWNTWIERRRDPRQTILHGLFVLDRQIVHKDGYLHIQLLDINNQAYAELKQEVPLPCAQRGVHLRIAIPSDLIAGYNSHVAEFQPRNTIDGAQLIEQLDTRTERLNPGQEPAILRIVIRNPSAKPIVRPRLVLEALDATDSLLGTWQTELDIKMNPGTNFTFEAAPLLPRGVEPSRVTARGYGSLAK